MLQEAVAAGEQGLPHRILQAAVDAWQAGVGINSFPEAIIEAALVVEGAGAEMMAEESSSQGGSEEMDGSDVSAVSYGPVRRLNGKRVCCEEEADRQ